jgi:zinc protease
VWYRVGAADDVSGKTGLAHFLEHLMFKGTTKHPYGDFDRLLDVNGAEGNAFTTQENTMYFQRTTADRLPLMMELESDRMQNLVLSEEMVKPELRVVREERRQRTENEPSALLSEQVDAALFTAHPYGRPVIGWMSEVAKLSMADAIAFYKQNYTPANAVLIVAGDVDPAKVIDLAKTYYGPLKNTFTPQPRVRTDEPAPLVARRLTMVDARVSSPAITRTYLTPSYAGDKKAAALSLDFLSAILGSGSKSRLNTALVLDQKLASFAGAWFDGSGRDYNKFMLYAVPNPGVDIVKLEAAMDAVINDVQSHGITQTELDRIRKQALAEQVYALDSQMALVNNVGGAVMNGLTAASALMTAIGKL